MATSEKEKVDLLKQTRCPYLLEKVKTDFGITTSSDSITTTND